MPGPTVGRAEVDVHADLSPFRRELVAAANRAGRDYGDTLATSIDSRLRRTTRIFDRFWTSTLRGSRNDFLNFVGVVSEGLERLVGRTIGGGLRNFGNALTGIGNILERLSVGPLKTFGEDFKRFGDNIRGLGAGGVDGLIIQLAGLSLAFQLLVAASGGLAAGLSGVAASVTALAVGIGGALLGGVVALTPAVAALGVGVGALALGLSEMSDAEKAAFDPLADLFGELREGVQEALFENLGDQVDGLTRALAPVGGVLEDVAGVFSDWVSDVISQIGPGGPLADSFEDLGESIPDTLRTLLDILSNLSGSLVGLFDAASPAAQRLLEGINGLLEDFNEWINSVEGQEALNDFLQEALDLLDSLGGIVGEVGEALGNFWTEGGADAAQDLLDNIGDLITQFNDWLDTEEGRQALLDFFENGVEVAEGLGDVVDSLIDLFDELDNTLSREGFQNFLDLLADGIDGLTDLVEQFNAAHQAVMDFLVQVELAGGFFETLKTGVEDAATSVLDFIAAVDAIGTEKLNEFFDSADVAREGIIEAFEDMQAKIQEFFDFIGTGAQSVIDEMVELEIGIRAALDAAIETVEGSLDSIKEAFDQLVADISLVLESTETAIQDFKDGVSDAFDTAAENIGSAVDSAVSAIGGFGDDVAEEFNEIARDVRRRVGEVVSSIRGLPGRIAAAMQRFAAAVQRGVERAVQRLRLFASQAVSAIIGLPGRMFRIGLDMMQGLLNGIIQRGASIIAYLEGLAQSAAATFARILGIASPSKVFEEFGRDIVDGLVGGIQGGITDVTDAANSLAGAATISNLNTPISALAAGSGGRGAAQTQGVGGFGDITIVTPYADPRLVALETMDALAAQGR